MHARKIIILGTLLHFLSTSSILSKPQGLHGYKVVDVATPDTATIQRLVDLDESSQSLEIWSEQVTGGMIRARVSPDDIKQLDLQGFQYSIVVDDLQIKFDEMFSSTGGDFFDSYRTYEQYVDFLNELAAEYPQLTQIVDLGTSVLGRHLWALKITGNSNNGPAVFFFGGQHGNEVMGPCVIAYMTRYLLQQYGTDPDVTNLVNNVDWYLLPIMNPDGYEIGSRFNANGADLNRDWGGPGSQPDPFSEPETIALRDFFDSHPNIRADIDFHTFGTVILWPWGHTNDLCIDHPTFVDLNNELHQRIEAVQDTFYWGGPLYSTLYPINGGHIDYVYGVLGLWSLTIEIGYDHLMPAAEIRPMSEELVPAMQYLGNWVYDCDSNNISDALEILQGTSLDSNCNQTPDHCEASTVMNPDFDGDGSVNNCDADDDNDGVNDNLDVCDSTQLGALVRDNGTLICDQDADCDVDWDDLDHFQNCFTQSGPNDPFPHPQFCPRFDFDLDLDVDIRDFAFFQMQFTGSIP